MKSLLTHTANIIASALLFAVITPMALPMGVLAQGEASLGIMEVSDLVISDSPTLDSDEAAVESAAVETDLRGDDFPDNYPREILPNSEEVFSDFVVGPGKVEIELAPGDTKVIEIIVSNRMGERKLFEFTTEDAEGSVSGESAITLLGERTGPYTLKDFISVPYEKFYLEHGQRARIPVTVSLPADAEPGGRYGSLLTAITTNPKDLAASGGAKPSSAVISRIGTLFFVTTPGAIDRAGQLQDFSTLSGRSFFFQGPIDLAITYENSGSVHLNPYGRVSVSNIIGEEVGTVELTPMFVMPKSLRTREVEWNRELLIGRYVAKVELNRGYNDEIDELTLVFWVFPWKIMTVVFAGLFTFFLVLRLIFSQFEFKRKR